MAFISSSNLTEDNPDGNAEVWLVDYDTQATVHPSPNAPTTLMWPPDPRAVRYDVIRGDATNLQAGPGNTVDLGTVVCLENDSIDTHTIGFEDSTQPIRGQVLFFLYRGTCTFTLNTLL